MVPTMTTPHPPLLLHMTCLLRHTQMFVPAVSCYYLLELLMGNPVF